MTTIICSDCNQAKGKEDFSKSQLKKKATEKRRCKSCAEKVDGNSNNNRCHHGCTKEEFNNRGEHHKVFEDYDRQIVPMDEFISNNKRVVLDKFFARYVIARITDEFLKGKNNGLLFDRLCLLVSIRYLYIPHNEGKEFGPKSEYTINHNKYGNDILTERGRIKCIVRETPCDCMEEKRIAAKSMEKVAICYGCHAEFLKERLRRCNGCDAVQYCSEECSIKHWPKHKTLCRIISSSSAPTLTTGSSPSSFGEHTIVVAEEM